MLILAAFAKIDLRTILPLASKWTLPFLNKFNFGVSCIFHVADVFMVIMKEICWDLAIFIM